MARLIGRAAALEIMLTGRPLDAADAQRVGLVHRVVAHDELLEAACATAGKLATRYKPGVAVVKRAVLEGGSMPLEQGLEVEQAGFLEMFGHAKVQAAMAAYVGFTEHNGMLPARNDDARQQLENGEFAPFYPSSPPHHALKGSTP